MIGRSFICTAGNRIQYFSLKAYTSDFLRIKLLMYVNKLSAEFFYLMKAYGRVINESTTFSVVIDFSSYNDLIGNVYIIFLQPAFYGCPPS